MRPPVGQRLTGIGRRAARGWIISGVVMKRPPRPPRFPAAADRPGAPARCITTRPPRLAGSVDMVVGQLRKSSAPGSQGASPTDPSLSLSLGRRRRGCTIRGHLPEIAARRVRSGLPAPPPSRVGARTPGSLRGSPPFSRCMWGDFGGRGRSAGETRDDRGEVAAGLQEIVSRAGFRGPGWALPGHAPAEGGWWIGPPARPNAVARVSQQGGWIPAISLECPGSNS